MNTMKEVVNQLKQAYASIEDSEERVKTISDEQIIQLQQVFYNFRIQRISKQDLNSSVSSILKSQEEENYEGRILYPAAAYEALRKEKDKIENELDEYKEHHEELTEHYKALQFLESEFRKENADLQLRLDAKTLSHQMMLDRTLGLQKENDDQKRKIIGLETELVEWNEFKKIRDAQMQALRKQMP